MAFRNQRWMMWLAGGLAVGAMLLVIVFWLKGMANSAAVIAILGLASALLTGSVNMIGQDLKLQSEQRLQLDAAMKAGELLAVDGDAVSPASAASGLLALTNLGHADLAVALLVDLWDEHRNKVSTESSMLVIDAALRSRRNPNAQLVAAELLCRNAERLDPAQALHWPAVIDGGWDPKFGPKTKLLLFDALVRAALSHEPTDTGVRSVVVRLYGVWRGDRDPHVRGCVGSLLAGLVPELRRLRYQDFLEGNLRVTMADVAKAAASASVNDDHYMARVVDERRNHLVTWAAGNSGHLAHDLHFAFGGLRVVCSVRREATDEPALPR